MGAICLGLQASQAPAVDIKIATFNIKDLGLTKALTQIALISKSPFAERTSFG